MVYTICKGRSSAKRIFLNYKLTPLDTCMYNALSRNYCALSEAKKVISIQAVKWGYLSGLQYYNGR